MPASTKCHCTTPFFVPTQAHPTRIWAVPQAITPMISRCHQVLFRPGLVRAALNAVQAQFPALHACFLFQTVSIQVVTLPSRAKIDNLWQAKTLSGSCKSLAGISWEQAPQSHSQSANCKSGCEAQRHQSNEAVPHRNWIAELPETWNFGPQSDMSSTCSWACVHHLQARIPQWWTVKLLKRTTDAFQKTGI